MEKNSINKGIKKNFYPFCLLALFFISCNMNGNKLTIVNNSGTALKNIKIQYVSLSVEDSLPTILPNKSLSYNLKNLSAETSVYIQYQTKDNKTEKILAVPYLVYAQNKNYKVEIP